jgi:hypothetical protein
VDKSLADLAQYIVAGISIVVAVFSVLGAFRSGVLTKLRVGSLELEAGLSQDRARIKTAIESAVTKRDEVPFEVEQLTNYYSQILSQSKISFWFSLVFASLGFVALLVAAFFYTSMTGGATVAQFVAGLIMEAVASLFFVQSKNAQKSMGDFFDKLRSDRLHMESRKMCETLQSRETQDALKTYLSLHYAGVPSAEIIAKEIFGVVLSKP